MMNQEQINAAAEIARTRTNDKRWTNAINRAVEESPSWIVTEHVGYILITSNSGETYRVNGHCNCKAGVLGQACKHLAYRRLTEIAATIEETVPAVSIADDVAATPRKALICEIKAAWPKTWPPIETELLARYRCSDLNFFADDVLRAIRLAIAL